MSSLPREPALVVSLPLPLATLVCHGLWHRVVLLGRWRCKQRLFRNDWPPADVFSHARARQEQAHEADYTAQATPSRIQAVAETLRRHSEPILGSALDGEERSGL